MVFMLRCYDKKRDVHVKRLQTRIFGCARNFNINRSFAPDCAASEVKVGVKVCLSTDSPAGRWTVEIGTCARKLG